MEESSNYTTYKKCYVAFIDILGFTKYVSENTCKNIFGTLLTLKIEAITGPNGLERKYGIDAKDVKILCISDSIIVSIEENIPYAFEAITEMCAVFQAVLLLNCGMLMRGGISCGDFYMDNSGDIGNGILFGPAYNRTVELEKGARYPIIKIDENLCINDAAIANLPFLTQSPLDGTVFVDYMSLAKTLSYFSQKMERTSKKIVDQIKICNSVKEKYDWTKCYIIKSLGDESIFSEEKLAESDAITPRQLNLCVKYSSEEGNKNGQP